jgi:hypothetical protein
VDKRPSKKQVVVAPEPSGIDIEIEVVEAAPSERGREPSCRQVEVKPPAPAAKMSKAKAKALRKKRRPRKKS